MDTFALSLENAHLGCWSAWRKCQTFAQQTVSFDWKPSPCTFQPSLCSLLGNNPCDVADRNVFWLHVYSAKPGFQRGLKRRTVSRGQDKSERHKTQGGLEKLYILREVLTHLDFFLTVKIPTGGVTLPLSEIPALTRPLLRPQVFWLEQSKNKNKKDGTGHTSWHQVCLLAHTERSGFRCQVKGHSQTPLSRYHQVLAVLN